MRHRANTYDWGTKKCHNILYTTYVMITGSLVHNNTAYQLKSMYVVLKHFKLNCPSNSHSWVSCAILTISKLLLHKHLEGEIVESLHLAWSSKFCSLCFQHNLYYPSYNNIIPQYPWPSAISSLFKVEKIYPYGLNFSSFNPIGSIFVNQATFLSSFYQR